MNLSLTKQRHDLMSLKTVGKGILPILEGVGVDIHLEREWEVTVLRTTAHAEQGHFKIMQCF